MPRWALRAGTAILQGLFGRDDNNNVIVAVLSVLLLFFMLFILLVIAPLVFWIVPLAEDNELAQMRAYIANLDTTTRTDYDPFGVSIPWPEVVAVYAILYDQDFDQQFNSQAVRTLARNWLERHETEVWTQDAEGKPIFVETLTWYTVKDLYTVAQNLGLTAEDIERAEAMIALLTAPD